MPVFNTRTLTRTVNYCVLDKLNTASLKSEIYLILVQLLFLIRVLYIYFLILF